MANVAPRTWMAIKKHVPSIKFRNTAVNKHHDQVVSEAAPFVQPTPATGPPVKSGGKVITIEDWQLAAKYKRKLISPEEIGYINRGGPQ